MKNRNSLPESVRAFLQYLVDNASSSLWRKSLIRPGPGAIEPVH